MIDELKKIGFSENEANVYMALLELGSSTAQQIARKANVNRATTYVQLESLMKMGMVATFEKGSKTFFRAEDPQNLQLIIERDKSVTESREITLQKILPGLENLFIAAGERPRVRFFEGIEGLRAMQMDFLKIKDKQIEAVASADDVLNLFPAHQRQYMDVRVKRGIRSKLIYTSAKGPFLKESDIAMLRESRFIPSDKFPFSCDITIYEDSVAIAALRKKPIGLVIESKEIADSIRSLFHLAWETAEKYQP